MVSLVCGGGAGLLLIPILGSLLPVAQVPAALTLGTSVSALSRLWLFSGSIHWGITFRFVPASLVGAVLGAWLLAYLEPMYIELCMGIFLVANLPNLLRNSECSGPKTETTQKSLIIVFVGLVAGLISALTGAVGVLFNRFYFRSGLSPRQVIATRAANEILLHIFKLTLYAGLHLFNVKSFQLGVIVALAAVFSSRIMAPLVGSMPTHIFSRIGHASMVLVGVLMLNSALVHIQSAADPDIRIRRLSDETEATLIWNKLIYTFEFNYSEGPELEQVIQLSEAPQELQKIIETISISDAELIIEKTYSLRGIGYEATLFDNDQQLIRKVEL
jgi:uncharacterized membrane protein YfcA